MEQIELLEAELILMQDNIKRLKEFYLKQKKEKFVQCQSLVVGELKHRSIALKQRLTQVVKTNTYNVLK